ncbi:L-ascorbate metabolism protein UlaG, beta-lactamase superfamily [Desulfonauticus submarinus]|uniref:UPF0173 metal-dependent hydrolase SAMN04488516_101155 n=1 Tax=Desulfonauticus submarinus TaxID=206665 RepID=A0A1G9ZUG3_9BACT|nr:metal-dependent hydrolase [Desulfonauticus submarinus]SDN24373.1 L-ascorbate metabolism protein UlaG, beta-lactamase superfamily [Desulfonauticus submarinus]
MSNQIIWHGHANFEIITPNLNILIDPWFEGNPAAKIGFKDLKKVDLVLVTHDHADHLGQAIEICKHFKAHLGTIVEIANACASQGVPTEQILNGIGFNIGGTVKFKDIQITMTQAFHSSEKGNPVGFIVQLENGYTIYHAGDTGIFNSMNIWGELYNIDLALLPIGGTFTMDPKQAAYACKMLKCKNVIPMHWGSFPVLEQNTDAFKKYLTQYAPNTQLIEANVEEIIKLS